MFYVKEDLAQWAVYILITLSRVFIMKGSSGKLFQIHKIWKSKSTGSVSFITYFLLCIGTIARTITILVEGKENIPYLVFMGLMMVLNGVIALQFLVYRKTKEKA